MGVQLRQQVVQHARPLLGVVCAVQEACGVGGHGLQVVVVVVQVDRLLAALPIIITLLAHHT